MTHQRRQNHVNDKLRPFNSKGFVSWLDLFDLDSRMFTLQHHIESNPLHVLVWNMSQKCGCASSVLLVTSQGLKFMFYFKCDILCEILTRSFGSQGYIHLVGVNDP